MTIAKICGLTAGDAVDAAIEAGADMLGFVFFEKSPRNVSPEEVAELLDPVPPEVREELEIVGLFVDPTDAEIDAVFRHVRLDIVQLHGSESPERVEEVRQEFAVEVIKAIGVSSPEDLKAAEPFVGVADYLLFDAKPPAGADRPGGNAQAFPGEIMKAWKADGPWLLAGGLTSENVKDAIKTAGAPGVDVSSGVEAAPGQKDPVKIEAFLAAVKG